MPQIQEEETPCQEECSALGANGRAELDSGGPAKGEDFTLSQDIGGLSTLYPTIDSLYGRSSAADDAARWRQSVMRLLDTACSWSHSQRPVKTF